MKRRELANPAHYNLDSATSFFFQRELEALKARSYDVEYPELMGRNLFAVSYAEGEGAEVIVYEQFDRTGVAKIIASYAEDLPLADVQGKEFMARVRTIGTAFMISIDEIDKAKMTGKPLQQKKADAARRAAMEEENRVIFFGDDKHGLMGLFDNQYIPRYIVPAGVSGYTQWTQKTPDEILKDLHGMTNSIPTLTKKVEQPNTLSLPVAQFHLIASTKVSQYQSDTILDIFLRNSPYIKSREQVQSVNEFLGAGPGGQDVACVFNNRADKVEIQCPMEFRQYPEQPRDLAFKIPCRSKTGGLITYYPMSLVIAEGI